MIVERPFLESWYLKLNDSSSKKSLSLRFNTYTSGNGFKRIAEVSVVLFEKILRPQIIPEIKKTALRQVFELSAFSRISSSEIKIGHCILSHTMTSGCIYSKGKTFQWDLEFKPEKLISFSPTPKILSHTGLVKNERITSCSQLVFSGTTSIHQEKMTWENARGMQGYSKGSQENHSWIRAHCNSFLNERGESAPFVFEGISARSQIGPVISPPISSFFFHYEDKSYFFNTLIHTIVFSRSKNTLNAWQFRADQGSLSFRGYARAEHKDFAGFTREDTNGSLLYCTQANLSNMQISIYKKNRLETTFISDGTADFEIVSREKNPYVPLLM